MSQRNPFDLAGRSALVTGGSRGLGRAIASAFAAAGAEVAISSRNDEDLRSAAEALRQQHGVRVEPIAADLARRGEPERLAAEAVRRLGKIDILVNNAGTNVPQPIDQVRDDDWDRVLQLNLTSCMALCRALVPGMKERRWGRIIHISSVMAIGSKEARNSYSATKAALIGMAKASALELGPLGITVNCIAPGPFATELPMSILSPEEQAAFARRTALGRWGQPGELAGPALLLASDAGSYITGSVLVVDGGILCRVM